MRTLGLVFVAVTGLGLSGCSQVSNVFKKKPHYHTADGSTIYTDGALRNAPQQPYEFADQTYNVDVYDGASQYAGYAVELYNTQPDYIPPAYTQSAYTQPAYTPVTYTDPRTVEFVKLNGKSVPMDWKNCETIHRGYLYVSESDFRLDPDFEVCMRNKGYVLTTESGPTSKQILSAKTAGLRGVYQPSTVTPAYSETYQSTTSNGAYPGYFR